LTSHPSSSAQTGAAAVDSAKASAKAAAAAGGVAAPKMTFAFLNIPVLPIVGFRIATAKSQIRLLAVGSFSIVAP
jgi:hypothetical protein